MRRERRRGTGGRRGGDEVLQVGAPILPGLSEQMCERALCFIGHQVDTQPRSPANLLPRPAASLVYCSFGIALDDEAA